MKKNLFDTITRIQREAEIAVRQGATQIILSDKEINSKKMPMPMLICVGAINTFLIEKKIKRICLNKCSIR